MILKNQPNSAAETTNEKKRFRVHPANIGCRFFKEIAMPRVGKTISRNSRIGIGVGILRTSQITISFEIKNIRYTTPSAIDRFSRRFYRSDEILQSGKITAGKLAGVNFEVRDVHDFDRIQYRSAILFIIIICTLAKFDKR